MARTSRTADGSDHRRRHPRVAGAARRAWLIRSRGSLYADTSALVKLVVREAESDALAREVSRWEWVSTRDITAVELQRATTRARANGRVGVADARSVLELLVFAEAVTLTDEVRAVAASVEPVELRALDAIHLASALSLGDVLAAVLTYDRRMAEAAEARGLVVIAPS